MSAIALADLKAHVNIPSGQTGNDAEMQGFLNAAERKVTGLTGITPGAATGTWHVYPVGRRLILPATYLTGITSVTDPDGLTVTVDAAHLNLAAGIIELPYAHHYRFPHRRAWTVVGTLDGAVHDDLRLAVLIIAAHLWQTQRVAGQGEARVPGFGSGGAGAAPGVSVGYAIPNRAAELLETYRMPV
jgi:hypothetical protein